MSFLELAMKKAQSVETVPDELICQWTDGNDQISTACLLHPTVRAEGTENDVRAVLEKKHMTLQRRVSSAEFVKLAARVRRRGSSHVSTAQSSSDSIGNVEDGVVPSVQDEEDCALEELGSVLDEPRWTANDERPAHFADNLLVGSAEHAADVKLLREMGCALCVGACVLTQRACDLTHGLGTRVDRSVHAHASADAHDAPV